MLFVIAKCLPKTSSSRNYFRALSFSLSTVKRVEQSSISTFGTLSLNYLGRNKFSSVVKPVENSKSMATDTSQKSSPTNGDRDKCVFCKIADGKEENEIFYQDDEVVVFQDIKPAAKHHLLIVPREHIRDSKSLTPSQLPLAKRLVEIGKQVLLGQMKKESPGLECLPAEMSILMGYHWPPFHSISHLHLHVIAPSDQMSFIGRTIFRPNTFWFVTADYIHDRLEKMTPEEKQAS